MKNTITTKFLTALTVTLLSQPLFATQSDISDNCLVPQDTEDLMIDAVKFTTIWLKLNKDEKSETGSQKHLEEYIKDALKENKGTLDVEKFSALWNKAGNNKNTTKQAHLQKALVMIVDKASGHICTHTK